ncbi:29719_t:CDS:2 [Gigaspora margarita]|uniref:29719_t:CDS:1 n=1 Tax=Gigaspora margarita TaxID=4874 RepID=A0ABN7UMT8_GIGMA|nr:29719_t:CDS:2 [Gigaspora margarita]
MGSSESNSALYRSVHSRLLNAHLSINNNSFKLAKIKNSDSVNKKSESASNVNFEDFHSSKRIRVVDEKDDNFEYYDKGAIEVNKECIYKKDEYKENNVCNSRSSKCSFAKFDKDKEKIIQPVVHNTRKQFELSKIVNSNEKV